MRYEDMTKTYLGQQSDQQKAKNDYHFLTDSYQKLPQ